MSTAKITLWGKTIGYVTWDEKSNSALFESEPEYIDSNLNIAPLIHPEKSKLLYGLNFNENFGGMIPVFNDSLPDSFGNVIFKEWLEQSDLDQSNMNPVERLLYVGTRGMGALEYQLEKKIPDINNNLNLEDLAEISDKIIKGKFEQSINFQSPEAIQSILRIGSSVGGAQAKILVALTKESRPENVMILPGDIIHPIPVDYYIIKLEHDPDNIWFKEKNYVEYVYNEIARNIGLNVADSKLIYEGGRAHFASKRFDRIGNKKVHMQTVCAIAGFYGRSVDFSYEDIFKIIEILKLPYKDKEQLFTQMVFNVIASNRDDHTKNFSFLMDETGEWSLSPAYDLTFPFNPYQKFLVPHKISINRKTKNIEKSDLLTIAKKVGIKMPGRIIDKVIENILDFPKKIKDYNVRPKTISLIMDDINKNINRL